VRAQQGSAEVHPLQRYPGYTDRDLEIFKKFVVSPGTPEPGFITDSLGVRTRVTALPDSIHRRAGETIGLPVPEDTYHAEAIEYIGLLKSVAAARHRYTVLELGAGWGPWLVAGAVAAKRAGISDIHLYGVEGDPEHCAFLRQHFLDNGLDPDEHTLLNAAVGAERGKASWPTGSKSSNNTWGMRPARQGSEADTSYLENSGASAEHYRNIEVLPIAELLQREEHWDLVHIDIQGWEAAVCQAGLPILTERTKYVVVGTHSRKLDGDVLQLFWKAGWVLENEKPTRFHFSADGRELENMTEVDGTQVWMNPTL
ncbi:MAG: FkbM family methyltransferase, partial [Gemmatimonadales bacterium]